MTMPAGPLMTFLPAAVLIGIVTAQTPATDTPATRAASTVPAQTAPAGPPDGRPGAVTVQPGIRIDWTRRQVEIDAVVILRQGLLELAACSPRIREHESILRIEARPMHLYQALGLIGLTPGRPPGYDPEAGRPIPATGDSLEIDVCYQGPGGEVVEPIENWMKRVGSVEPLGRLPWVFAGSSLTPDGRFAADVEGTVIAVVDFPTSLIALAESHSSRNEELWLEPRTVAIPAVGQKCRLIIRPGPLRVSLDAAGRIAWEGRPVTLGRLHVLLAHRQQEEPNLRVVLECDPASPPVSRQDVMEVLKRRIPGFSGQNVILREIPPVEPAGETPYPSPQTKPDPPATFPADGSPESP